MKAPDGPLRRPCTHIKSFRGCKAAPEPGFRDERSLSMQLHDHTSSVLQHPVILVRYSIFAFEGEEGP
jgi:hypothetical protein